MPFIVITLRDMPDGSTAVQMMDEPHVFEGQTEFSPAQHLAAAALTAIHAQLQDRENSVIDLSAAPSAQPQGEVVPFEKKLTIVGTDEMPLH